MHAVERLKTTYEVLVRVLTYMLFSGAMMVALGSGVSGVFTNSEHMWELMHKVGFFNSLQTVNCYHLFIYLFL